MKYYIYILINKINGKMYVGQTNNLAKRLREHKAKDRLISKRTPLYHAINKYGFENFQLIEIESFNNEKDVDEAEIFLIQFFETRNRKFGYNIAEGGKVNRGFKHSEKFREEQSLRKIEYFKHNKNTNLGKKQSEEFKTKLSNLWKGEKSLTAKLTNCEAQLIRKLRSTKMYSIKDLANMFSVSQTTIYSILINKYYQ